MPESSSPSGFVAPEPADLAPLFPAYEICDLIATGGMGAVYRAVQKSLDRTVALKILPMEFSEDADFCAGFEAEAKAMARLNHPNLIGVYDFGEVNGMLFIVMEFVPGKSIYHSANGIAIDPGEVIRLITGVCNGLAHAHENGILHRDIKPSNILLTVNAEPKIGDFGLARPIEQKAQADEVIFGTPGYTAPEVINAPDSVDHRTDLFSVGILLHELLTGKLPADDSRPASVISRCDLRFDAIIRRATNPVPATRYSSAAEIATDLQKIIARPVTGPMAKGSGVAKTGARRPPQPVRGKSAEVKRKSVNLTWVGPLVAIAIMVYSWHTFMNMKPKVVMIEDPAAKTLSAETSEEEADPLESSAETQTTEPSLPQPSRLPLQPAVQPSDSNSQDAAQPAADIRQSVFLDDLKETDFKTANGRLGKHGSGPDKLGSPARVKGTTPEHSLCPHPPQNGTSLVTYSLNGQFSVFSGTATVTDNASPQSLSFCIKGDGKILWRSKVIQNGNDAEEFSVSVEGINKLELEIECPGSATRAWGIWVSPRLLTTSMTEQTSGKANLKSTEYGGSKTAVSGGGPRVPPPGIPQDADYFNGKWYKIYQELGNWKAARDKCLERGGRLGMIPDAATQDFLKNLTMAKRVWLGATDEAREGQWLWSDGGEMSFKAFGPNEPGTRASEDYLFMVRGIWCDTTSDDASIPSFVCEWPDKPVDLAAASSTTAPPAPADEGVLPQPAPEVGIPSGPLVGTWKYSDTVQLEIRSDGTIFSNSKAAGKWTQRDKVTEYFLVLNDRSTYIATLDKYKRILTTESRARGERKSMERIDNGPTRNPSVPDQITSWKMEVGDLETDIKSLESQLKDAKRDAADKWRTYYDARAYGRISSGDNEAKKAEKQASLLDTSINESRARLAEVKAKLRMN